MEYVLPQLRWRERESEEEAVVDGMFPVARFLAERLGLAGETELERNLNETLVEYVGKYYDRKSACLLTV